MPKLSDCTLKVGAVAVAAAYFRGEDLISNAYTNAKTMLLANATNAAMFIASPAYSAINTDGSGAVTNGSAVGLWRDYVSGTATMLQSTAGKKLVARQVPVLGPELVTNGTGDSTVGWSGGGGAVASVSGEFILTSTSASGAATCARALPVTAGLQYLATADLRNISAGVKGCSINITAPSTYASALSTSASTTRVSATFTAQANSAIGFRIVTSSAVGMQVAADNISVREITGYTQQWEFVSDGIDDVLVGSPGPTLSDGLVMVWAGSPQRVEPGQGRYADLWAIDGTLQEFGITATTSNSFDARLRVTGFSELNLTLGNTFQLGTTYVVTAALTSTTLSIRVNGGAWGSVAHGRTLTNGVLIPAVGARTGTSLFSNATHDYLTYANLGANATDANIRILEEAAAKAAGVTLS